MTYPLFCPSSIAWGDIATWVTGAATLSAVVVALVSTKRAQHHAEALQNAEWQRQEQSQQARAGVLAYAFHLDCVHELKFLEHLLPICRALASGVHDRAEARWMLLNIFSNPRLPMLTRFLDEMDGLSDDVRLAAMHVAINVRAVNYDSGRLPDFESDHQVVEFGIALIPSVNHAIDATKRLRDLLKKVMTKPAPAVTRRTD